MNVISSDIILERMMSLHPKEIDLTLDRVHRLLKLLGSPEKLLPPAIHIAGTNGKGSTLAMLRSGLESERKEIHAYTSPHLERFHERIRLAGKLIKESELSAILNECYAANGPSPITFFEITTCAAFLAMARSFADYTLMEVGLGGRLDATNVIARPKLCIITPISIDHERFLGDTIAKIALEKAGIIKKEVPVIVGPQSDEAMEVIEEVAAKHLAPVIAFGKQWHVLRERERFIFQDEIGLCNLPLPVLPGEHQIINAGSALAALRYLNMPHAALEAAVNEAEWPARMQRLKSGLLVKLAGSAELWLDGGHNAAAGQALATFLETLPPKPTFLICGMLNTKDVLSFLRPFSKQIDGLWGITVPHEDNTLPAEETVMYAKAAGIIAQVSENVKKSILEIKQKSPLARILICGSLYLAGNVLRENNKVL